MLLSHTDSPLTMQLIGPITIYNLLSSPIKVKVETKTLTKVFHTFNANKVTYYCADTLFLFFSFHQHHLHYFKPQTFHRTHQVFNIFMFNTAPPSFLLQSKSVYFVQILSLKRHCQIQST